MNLFHKVNFPRKSKRCFKLRKSNYTEQPSVTRSIREKSKGCTKHLPLLTVFLQGEPLLFNFNELPDFPSNLCTDAQSPGWFWPPHQRTGVSEAYGVFPPPRCPPSSWPRGCCPVLHRKEQPAPSLHMGSPTSSYERISL